MARTTLVTLDCDEATAETLFDHLHAALGGRREDTHTGWRTAPPRPNGTAVRLDVFTITAGDCDDVAPASLGCTSPSDILASGAELQIHSPGGDDTAHQQILAWIQAWAEHNGFTADHQHRTTTMPLLELTQPPPPLCAGPARSAADRRGAAKDSNAGRGRWAPRISATWLHGGAAADQMPPPHRRSQ